VSRKMMFGRVASIAETHGPHAVRRPVTAAVRIVFMMKVRMVADAGT